jgi:hypothetical protein
MGYRYGISNINEIEMGIDMEYGNTGYRYGMQYIDMVINHIDMVILDIDMECGISIIRDVGIDTVILDIDMGYLVTLGGPLRTSAPDRGR